MRRYHSSVVLEKPAFPPKARTVALWEAHHPEFFVGLIEEHSEDCKCYPACFNKALDRLVSKSGEALNDSGTGLDQHNELASDKLQERSTTDGFDTIQHFDGR